MRMQVATPEAYKLLHDGTLVLAQVEQDGIRIDTDYLDRTLVKIEEKIRNLDSDLRQSDVYKVWKKRYGSDTNLDSGQQMATVFFKDLGYKNRSDKLTWDEATFMDVDHPFIYDYFHVKKLKKLHSTYLMGVRAETAADGFMRPSFNLAGGFQDDKRGGAITYRSSSSMINFQNIPSRVPWMAKIIRRCFIARDGHQLGENDYRQLEVCAAAFYHKDPTMLDYLHDPTKDMHRDAAMDLFGIEAYQVSKFIRYQTKNGFVFPEFYGSYFGNVAMNLWEAIKRSSEMRLCKEGDNPSEPTGVHLLKWLEKKRITELGDVEMGGEPSKGTFAYEVKYQEDQLWNEKFPVYAKWKKDFYTEYQKRGGVRILSGFWCGGVMKRNEVINYPVQGVAFHCLLQSMIWIHKELRRRKMRTRLVGQIHDSLLADVHHSEVEDYFKIARHVMTVLLPQRWTFINVPLEVEAELSPLGKTWYDKEKYDL